MAPLRVLELPGTVDLHALQAVRPERYPALFRTAGGDTGWDILFAFPQQIDAIASDAGAAALLQHPALQLPAGAGGASPSPFPFTGGWLAFFSYELGGLLEPRARRGTAGGDFPVAWLARVPAAILRDPDAGRCVFVAEAEFSDRAPDLMLDIAASHAVSASLPALLELDEEPPQRFLDGVMAIRDYIRAGDVFQVNLSRGWRADFAKTVQPSALFASLMQTNPAPFSALLQFDAQAIVSSSPERLVRVERGGTIHTRPIAGTFPRGATADEDDRFRERLTLSPKERAEHVMLVDLERNDLGRVCMAGSVRVDALMDVTRYRFVQHLESTIAGQLKAGTRVLDVLRAVFPGGTITGCPKIRTMQIIGELETTPREAYTGSVGYINHDGSLDFNILIRSFQLRGRQVRFRAGAGIVADSEAARELAETRHKARGLLRALGAV